MCLWTRSPLRRPQPHEVNQVRLCGPLFHQEASHIARCGGITFYHWIHIRGNGDLAHGACDLRSTSRMLAYVPCVSHKLKKFIWTQLRLGYTMKQIYDKHKKIWWEQTNASGWMTWDDFL
jgi:hypothetical protein